MRIPSAFDLVAPIYDSTFGRPGGVLSKVRERFVPQISGKTLDLAVGTGPNIAHYPDNSEVTLMDLSPEMLKRARIKADEAMENRPGLNLSLVECSLESMPFEDESFDTVLSIDVFCSCRDLEKAMDEAYRVLKPGGRAIFVEHFRTGRCFTDLMLGLLTYTLSWPLFGIRFNRPIDESIRKRFHVEEHEHLGKTFQSFICIKKPATTTSRPSSSSSSLEI